MKIRTLTAIDFGDEAIPAGIEIGPEDVAAIVGPDAADDVLERLEAAGAIDIDPPDPEREDGAPSLVDIDGLGKATAIWLKRRDIDTVAELAALDDERIRALQTGAPARVKGHLRTWRDAARTLIDAAG